ncbi:MAG: hypothetical protein Q9183_005599 [Haloplaca sp. 2 TL-2023]
MALNNYTEMMAHLQAFGEASKNKNNHDIDSLTSIFEEYEVSIKVVQTQDAPDGVLTFQIRCGKDTPEHIRDIVEMAVQGSFTSLRNLLVKPIEKAKAECSWFDLIYRNTQPALAKSEISGKHGLAIVEETKERWHEFKANLEAVDAKLKLSAEAVKLMAPEKNPRFWRNLRERAAGDPFRFAWLNSGSGNQANSGSSTSNS